MNETNQKESLTEANLQILNDRDFNLKMAEVVWQKVKGYPIPGCYSEEDRLGIFERYYHRAVAMSQGE